MRVLGIDWARSPRNRAACWLRRQNAARWVVDELIEGVDDQKVCALIEEAQSVVGVDIPFGWPREFRSMVSAWSPQSPTPVPEADAYRFRLTDRIVRDEGGKQPLSVSSDLISLATRTWCELVHAHGWHEWIDTTGAGDADRKRIIETYPAASLVAFLGRYPVGYKKSRKRRAEIAAQVLGVFPAIRMRKGTEVDALSGRVDKNGDHVLDAFLCAVTAALAAGWSSDWSVRVPEAGEREEAQAEGWMFFPVGAPS